MDRPAHPLTMTLLMTPDMANLSGNVHGGTSLKFLDHVASAFASRCAARHVVTLSVDQAMFSRPIHVGERVTFMAAVDDERKPVALRPPVPGTPHEQRWHSAADVRKQLRQEFGKRVEAIKGTPAP